MSRTGNARTERMGEVAPRGTHGRRTIFIVTLLIRLDGNSRKYHACVCGLNIIILCMCTRWSNNITTENFFHLYKYNVFPYDICILNNLCIYIITVVCIYCTYRAEYILYYFDAEIPNRQSRAYLYSASYLLLLLLLLLSVNGRVWGHTVHRAR